MADFTNPYERLLSSAGSTGGGAGPTGYRAGGGSVQQPAPPPQPTPVPYGDHLHARTVHDALAGRYLSSGAGTGGLPFLSSLYGSSSSGGSPLGGGPPSPFRNSTCSTSSLVNTRTFWPPTPPPDAYSRCGVGGGYYPMFSSLGPDMAFSCQNLLSRLPSTSSSPFSHLLAVNHKDAPFLPLRLNSPVTPHPLGVPPYLHLPTPSLDHRYPSTPGLYSPLSLHGLKTSPPDVPQSKLPDSDPKAPEKIIKSELLVLPSGLDKDPLPLRIESVETKHKHSPKVASVKAREKHETRGHRKLSATCSGHRKVSAIIPGCGAPIVTATVSPCVVAASGQLPTKTDPVKCSKCSASVDETCETTLVEEERKDNLQDTAANVTVKSFVNVAAPASHTNVTNVSATAVTVTSTGLNSSVAGNGVTSVTYSAGSLMPESLGPKTSDIEPIKKTSKGLPPESEKVLLSTPKVSPPSFKKDDGFTFSTSETPPEDCAAPTVATPRRGSNTLETHVSTMCTFSSWVHHQTSVTSVIQKEESDACLHAVQSSSQTTVVNLSMDKSLPAVDPNTQTTQSKNRTMIFKMQNTRKAQQVKCHQINESTDEIKCAEKHSSKCEIMELSSEPSQIQAMNLTVDRNKSPKHELSSGTGGAAVAQEPSENCDIKVVPEATATQSLDALSRLAKAPSGSARSSPAITWSTVPNKVKPSSVVSAIQSENLQPPVATVTVVKRVPEVMPCSPIVASSVSSPCIMSSDISKNKEVNARDEVKLHKFSSILSHEPANISAVSISSNPITTSAPSSILFVLAPSSIPVGIAVAQLRQDSSIISIKKAVVKANSVDLKTSPYSIPAMVDKGDKRFIKPSIAPVPDTTMIVNPTPSLGQWDTSGAMVRPTTLSGSWLTPAAPLVTPTVWLGQASSYQGGTHLSQGSPCLGTTMGSLMEATAVPPVGYQLARDPLSGHLFLIPAQNIELVDRSNIWSTYTPNAIQQVISHFPTTINGTKKELKPLLSASQLMEKTDLPLIQPRLLPMDQTLTQEIKEMKGINTAVQSSVTSITVQTGQPFTFPGFAAAPQPTLSYFYDQPTIVHIAQSQSAAPTLTSVTPVQAEPGKRSQGTSPLNPMTPSPPPQHCSSQVSEYESDADSTAGSETSTKPAVGVTASCQVDMDAYTNSNDTDYEERMRAVEVFDSANQTDNILLDSFKEEPDDSSPASLVVREEEEEEKLLEPDKLGIKLEGSENSLGHLIGNIDTEEEEAAAPVLPTESKPVIDFIDQHGLNLLVDSIEEFASREDPNTSKHSIYSQESALECANSQPKMQSEFSIDPSCTDGLGLLCALAEQRFLEETKNGGGDCRAHSCSPEPYQTEFSSVYRESKSLGQSRASRSGSRCHSPVLLNPAELEMRFKLAELQRKYKIKQMELARLKPRKDRDSSSSESSGPHSHWSTARDSSEEGFRSRRVQKQSSEFEGSPSCKAGVNHLGEEELPHKEAPVATCENVSPYVSEPEQVEAVPSTLDHISSEATEVASLEQPFPNLVKIVTKKSSKSNMVSANNSASNILPKSQVTSSKKKKEKDLFQLWNEKKLEELGKSLSLQLSSKQKTCKPKSETENIEICSKKEIKSHSQKNDDLDFGVPMDCAVPKEDEVSKRKADALETNLEEEPCSKRQKIESKNENIKEDVVEDGEGKNKLLPETFAKDSEKAESKICTEQKNKKREKRLSNNNDDVWNRRRSERIFLHDAGVILPTSLAYNSQKNQKNHVSGQPDGSKAPKHEESKRKMTRKEFGPKKIKLREEKQNCIPSLEMFLAMRQCRLGEMRCNNPSLGLGSGLGITPQDDSSGSEGDLPLSVLILDKKNLVIPDLPSCQMQVSDLRDCQRVLMEEDGLYYAGYITAIQAPDVYGITLDRERGNRPHIFSREEMLQQTVKEVRPMHVKQIPVGTRVCAYWSQQYRCLYPGTVTKGNSSEVTTQEKDTNTVFVEFDDGDSGRIPLEDVRLLIPDPDYEPDNSDDLGVMQEQPEPIIEKESPGKPESEANEKCSLTPNLLISKELQDKNVEPNTSNNLVQPLENNNTITDKIPSEFKFNKSPKIVSNVKNKLPEDLKVKKAKRKSKKSTKPKSEQNLKIKSEKNKSKDGEKTYTADTVPAPGEEVKVSTTETSSLESTDGAASSDGKTKKMKKNPNLEGKKISKLKKSSFVLKKTKHRFTDSTGSLKSSVLEKIKNCLKKSSKIKGEGKDKNKAIKNAEDSSPNQSPDEKVKKRKKHKTDHKHHHKHHKRHCHHHHKKHKRKGESSDLSSVSEGSPGFNSTLYPEQKETKEMHPICCISPGRSELSVTIKNSPPYTGLTTESAFLPTVRVKDKAKLESSEGDLIFSFDSKSVEKTVAEVRSDVEGSKKEVTNESKAPKKRRERKISCEKSKIAAFLPARQLWRWSGKSFKRPGTKGKAKKEYFKAITRGKETINVGDCAVFLSTGRPHLPYVGRIETMWQSWGGNTVVKVTWFYHPEETKGGKKLAHPKGALFQSPHVDENDVQTISHKCEVMSWKDYQKWSEKRVSSGGLKVSYENEDVYYLAGNYEPLAKVLTLEPGVS